MWNKDSLKFLHTKVLKESFWIPSNFDWSLSMRCFMKISILVFDKYVGFKFKRREKIIGTRNLNYKGTFSFLITFKEHSENGLLWLKNRSIVYLSRLNNSIFETQVLNDLTGGYTFLKKIFRCSVWLKSVVKPL